MAIRRWGTVLLLVFLVGGCSNPFGSDPEPAADAAADDSPAGFTAWQADLTSVCRRFEPRLEARTEELGGAQMDSLAEAATVLDQLAPLNDRYIAAILRVPPPEHRRAEVRRLYRLTRRLSEAAATMQAAAHFNDQPSFVAASDQLTAVSDEANGVLEDLDLQACI